MGQGCKETEASCQQRDSQKRKTKLEGDRMKNICVEVAYRNGSSDYKFFERGELHKANSFHQRKQSDTSKKNGGIKSVKSRYYNDKAKLMAYLNGN